jgi:hypothetical protein
MINAPACMLPIRSKDCCWTSDLLTFRSDHGAVTYQGDIYIFGKLKKIAHKNTAARQKSRLSAAIKSMAA